MSPRSNGARVWTLYELVVAAPVLRGLPAVVGEGLVGLGHLVDVFPLFDRRSRVVGGVKDLAGQAPGHIWFLPLAGDGHQPANGQGAGPPRGNLHGNLIRSPAYPPGPNLHVGTDVVDRSLEDHHRVLADLAFDQLEGSVDDAAGGVLPGAH